MEVGSMPFLLVTANVGSVFEDPSRLLKPWIKEFLGKVALLRPQFLALHLQEVGGKTYDKSMEYVQEFIKMLCEAEELTEYSRIRIYLDEDYNSAEHFTALGNLYFAHQSLQDVKIWNFLTHEWEGAEGKSIHTGNIEAIATKEKAKFPQHFFPECKWSRKGFLRTRWELNCTVMDFVNIHLFHDASNLAASEEFPSVYCKTRRRALVHTLERFHRDAKNGVAPYFVFGDFNFRCDTGGVIKKLTEDLTAHRIQNAKNDNTKLQYRNSDGMNVLTVGKKEFNHADHQSKFKESWLQQFDRELEPLREVLVEYPITFPPSYPYEEDPDMPKNYMSTRCPSWCDRIVMSPLIRELIVDEAFSSMDYNIIGESICMGDHKPVFLSVHVKTLQGTVRCCYCHEHASQQSFSDVELVNINLIKQSAYCLYSSQEFKEILLECRKLDQFVTQDTFVQNTNECSDIIGDHAPANLMTNKKPSISINITDSDNFNVCMCSVYSDMKDNNTECLDNNGQIDGTICPRCCNIIKMQPIEHRRTLVSKRLMLANNIIVNRIDTHYLAAYLDTRQDPYTPESAESRSPCPELDLTIISHDDIINAAQPNNNIPAFGIDMNAAKDLIRTDSRGVVSPRQLKSRLEHLQRESITSELAEIESHNLKKRKRCFGKCCIIS